MSEKVTLEDIRRAQVALEGVIYKTPLQEFSVINDLLGGRLFFKLENLQRTGSFKLRGAYNRICHLSRPELDRGVVAASAGNHAQGVALSASLVGTGALIVMPEGASLTKIEATRNYGAEVLLTGETFDDALAYAKTVAEEQGRVFIPAFDDRLVIAGQGTVGLEILDERPNLDVLVVPVGGGGLISGIATAAKSRFPKMQLIGVQTEGADASARSWREKRIVETSRVRTIADGIRVKRPGMLTFQLMQELLDDMVTVSEHDISRAILLLLEQSKLVVEGAGAVGLAAMMAGKIGLANRRVGIVVSGGNIDVTLLSRIIDKGLVEEGRQFRLWTVLGDQPGELSRLLAAVARLKANVLRVGHERWNPDLSPAEASIELVLETRDHKHIAEICRALQEQHYDVRTNAHRESKIRN